ncbi:hypothetical protein JCM3770_003781 [Rhodotorula araucariae]
MLPASSRTALPRRSPVAALAARRSFASTRSPCSPVVPPVVGSAPQMPRHLLIHAPHPTNTWPSHLDSTSPLYRALAQRWATHPELSKLGFGVTDAGTGPIDVAWDPKRSKLDKPDDGPAEEVYSATVYPDFLHIPSLSMSSLAAFESTYLSLPPAPSPPSTNTPAPSQTHIFVCTHASRDCRCGDLGEPLYAALVREARRRKVGGELRDGDDGVRIARVAHIGGHKWAGNALVYREGGACDWYGLLRAEDAPKLLDYATSSAPLTPWYTRWRGRVGLSPADVRAAFVARPTAGADAADKADEPRAALGDRVELAFVTFEGDEIRATGYEGESVMETAKRHDLPSILATCGGHCECATCHVHLAEGAPQPEMRDEEDEQLEFAIGADDDSRLACQLPVTKELGAWVAQGGRIRLPRY